MRVVIISGGFDPVHSGHLKYISEAKKLGDKLVIALNSDNWLVKKKGKYFLPFNERKIILENFKDVDKVISFEDDLEGSATNGILKIKSLYPDDQIIFANGGDRSASNIPEMKVKGVAFEFSVGGDTKLNSSSWILKEWKYEKEERVWGSFFNLFEKKDIKIKELIVRPKQGMSFQKHNKRSEIWFVYKGSCEVFFSSGDPESKEKFLLKETDTFHVPKLSWHQIVNPFKDECIIIEIQYGSEVSEEDIERLYYYKEDS